MYHAGTKPHTGPCTARNQWGQNSRHFQGKKVRAQWRAVGASFGKHCTPGRTGTPGPFCPEGKGRAGRHRTLRFATPIAARFVHKRVFYNVQFFFRNKMQLTIPDWVPRVVATYTNGFSVARLRKSAEAKAIDRQRLAADAPVFQQSNGRCCGNLGNHLAEAVVNLVARGLQNQLNRWSWLQGKAVTTRKSKLGTEVFTLDRQQLHGWVPGCNRKLLVNGMHTVSPWTDGSWQDWTRLASFA